MDRLPQELIDRIFGRYLEREIFKNTVTVSRTFQLATERASWKYNNCHLTESRLEKFLQIYSGHRLNYLVSLEYRTSFPPVLEKKEGDVSTEDDDLCRDSVADLRAMDEGFTRQINALFAALKTLENRIGGNRAKRIKNIVAFIEDTWAGQFTYSHRRPLPQLSAVSSLVVKQDSDGQTYLEEAYDTPAKLDLRVLLDLCVKLPNLEYLGCELVSDDWSSFHVSKAIRHFTRQWAGPHRDTRHEFAKTLQISDLPKTLKRVQFKFIDRFKFAENIDQLQLLPDLIKPALHDPFSSSLRLFSCHLRKLQLRVVADETLFWPSDGSIPYWPNLECLDVMFHMATPKGTWYFQGPKDEGRARLGFEVFSASYPPFGPDDTDTYWHERDPEWTDGMDWSETEKVQFRIIPDDDVLSPFLTGFAKATLHMPSLKKSTLWTSLSFSASDMDAFYQNYSSRDLDDDHDDDDPLAWGIIYLAPGEQPFHGRNRDDAPQPSNSRQIWWKVGGWKPEPDLHHLFRQIGGQHAGDLVETWEDKIWGTTLVGRGVFDGLDIV